MSLLKPFKQPFTQRIRRTLHGCLVPVSCLLAAGTLPALAAKSTRPPKPVPSVRIPLAALGFPGYTTALMHAGASMTTLHLLDSTHLLFTFSLRSLVPRLPGDDKNDQDRLVAAEVIELPSGKVLARTEWHLHDHGRYLWSVGQGLFVLRSGDALSTFAPLRGLAAGDAFQRVSLPHHPGHPEVVTGSADGQIVTVELQHAAEEEKANGDEEERAKHKRTTFEFFRVLPPAEPKGLPRLRQAGAVGAPGLMRLALDGDGYLWAEDAQRNRWAVSFNEYEGKPQDLAQIDSTCGPRLELLSRSQFVALTCGVSENAEMLAAYGFDGHETWQEPFGETLQPPTFVASPDAGRFVMSRLTASSNGDATPTNVIGNDDGLLNQELRVYGTESGDLLLDVQCVPVARTPENFDLSADGRTLAVLSRDAINLYTLPDLNARDRKDLADVQTMTPPLASGPVTLRRITRPVVAENAVAPEETTAPQPPLPTAADTGRVRLPSPRATADPSAAPAGNTATSETTGNTETTPRKPPTLLKPGEAAEYKDANTPESSPR